MNRTNLPVALFGAPKTAGRSFRADTQTLYGKQEAAGVSGDRCSYRDAVTASTRTLTNALTDIAPATLSLIRKYLVAHDTPLYNLARDRLMKEIKAVERATGARLGKTCGIDGDDDDGDDDATLVRARPGGK